MIIESGIDLLQVLCGSFGDDEPVGLWIIALDDDLRLLSVEPLVVRPVDTVENHVADIARYVDDWSRVAYFALAWSQHVTGDDPDWLREADERLRADPELAGARMLGSIVFDGRRLFASVPRCNFSFEAEYRDLPRAQSIPGPHGFGCACGPCSADRRAYDDSRDDYYDDSRGDYDDDDPHLEVDGSQFDPVWKRWFPEPERAYKRWTLDEEETIAQSHFAGLSCFDISMLVRRQPRAVASRLNKLGISSRTYVAERDFPGSALPGVSPSGNAASGPSTPAPTPPDR